MFQKNSAPQEESQSATSQSFHFPRSTDVAGDLGTFSRAIVVEAPGYVERRAVHSALSFVVHL